MVDAYCNIIVNYPTPEALAYAEPLQLVEIIRPLGFLYRAKELQTMANELMARHSGDVPFSYEALMNLTGVGEYTARAVLCFAFGAPVAIVDTNVARFLHRLHGIHSSVPANPARSKNLLKMADAILHQENARDYNYALLDLCSVICKVKNPACSNCPVLRYCHYGLSSGNDAFK